MPVSAALRYSKAFARGMILPRPTGTATSGPVVVAGMFRTGSGLGRAAQRSFEALQAAGANPVAVDLSGLLNQADLAPQVPLSPFPAAKQGTLILFANPPEVERALMGLGLRRWHDWRIIGAWVWELPTAPAEWRRQEKFVSEIWAPSRFVAEGFKARFNRPVQIVPYPVPVPAELPADHPAGEPLRILTIADARSSLERKNPLAAINMFRAAFAPGDAAELTIKCRNLNLFPAQAGQLRAAAADPRIRFEDATLSDAEQAALVARADILLSPHRSEGFGLNLAEAMAAGKCVVATGWSGNMDFMTDDTSVLLPATLVPAADPAGIYDPPPGTLWADPDFAAGVAALKALAVDPGRRRDLGQRARVHIADTLGPAMVHKALANPPLPA